MFNKDAGVVAVEFTAGAASKMEHIRVPVDGNGDYDVDALTQILSNIEEQVANAMPSNPEAIEALIPEEVVTPDCEKCARKRRDMLLFMTDWTQMPDAVLTEAQKSEVLAYRQALREVPTQSGFPENVTWPTLSFADAERVDQILTAKMDCSQP